MLSVADLEKEVAVSIGACHHRIALLPPCAAPAAAALPDDDDDDDWEDRHHEAPSPPEEPDVDERIMEALGSAGMFVGGGRSSYDPHRHGGLGMGNTMGKRSAPGMLACEMGPPPKLPKLPKLPKPLTAKPPPPKPPPPKPPPPKQPSETELATSAAAAAREAKRLKKVEEENRKIKEAVTKWFELLLKTLEAQKRREESEHSKMLAELAKREAQMRREENERAKMFAELVKYVTDCGGNASLVDGFTLGMEKCVDAHTGGMVTVQVWCAPAGQLTFRSRVDVARHFELIQPKRGGGSVASPTAAAVGGFNGARKRTRVVDDDAAADDDDDEDVVRAGAPKRKTTSVSVKLQRIGGSLGIALSDDNQITAVHAGGAGAIAGLKVGDVVNEVDGKSVHLASFGSLLPKEKDAVITMRVRRFVETEAGVPKAEARDEAGKGKGVGKCTEPQAMGQMEKVLSSRKAGRSTEYLVKWKGAGVDASTWVAAKSLDAELLEDFESGGITAAAVKTVGTAKTAPEPSLSSVGKRKAFVAAAAAADDDDEADEDEEDSDEEPPAKKAAPPRPSAASSSSAPPAAASAPPPKASAPPSLFKSAPSASTGAPRTIHIVGAQGSASRIQATGGKASITLRAGEGLKELKKAIRQTFGLYKHHKLSKLMLVPTGGSAEMEAKKNDLVNGVTVRCTYSYSSGNGNIGAFGPGGRRRGGFGRGRFSGMPHEMMMLMLLQGRAGFDDYGSDVYGSDDYDSDGSY